VALGWCQANERATADDKELDRLRSAVASYLDEHAKPGERRTAAMASEVPGALPIRRRATSVDAGSETAREAARDAARRRGGLTCRGCCCLGVVGASLLLGV
jgi:hypothetical protein